MSTGVASPTATDAAAVTVPPETFEPDTEATLVRTTESAGARTTIDRVAVPPAAMDPSVAVTTPPEPTGGPEQLP